MIVLVFILLTVYKLLLGESRHSICSTVSFCDFQSVNCFLRKRESVRVVLLEHLQPSHQRNLIIPWCFFVFPLLVISHVDNIHSHLWVCSDRVVLFQTYLRVIHWQTLKSPPPLIIVHCLLGTDLYVFICGHSCSVKLPFSTTVALLLFCSVWQHGLYAS